MTMPRSSPTIGVAAICLMLSACNNGGGDDLGLVEEGALTVCSEVPYPPFEFEDPDAPSGYSGFDMDLVQAIADGLGVEMVVDEVGFDSLMNGLVFEYEMCDLAASAITITDERREILNFSDPYYDSLQSILVSADSGIASISGLAGKTVGVQQETTGEAYANKNLPEGAVVQPYPGDAELWPALQAGRIDAILQDFPVNDEHADNNRGYTVVEVFETDEHYGFAFAKGENENAELIEAINEHLAQLREDGTYDEIYQRYFDVR